MKRVAILCAAAMLSSLSSTPAAAEGLEKNTDNYQRVHLFLNLLGGKGEDKGDGEDHTWTDEEVERSGGKGTGVGLGYLYGLHMSQNIPIFLEFGANLAFTFHKVDDSEDEDERDDYPDLENKYTYMNLAIPVNAAYKFSFASGKVLLKPFFGINLRFNLLAKNKYEYVVDGKYNRETQKYEYEVKEEDINLFDDGEEGEKSSYKRFQFGLNAGVGATFLKHLYVGWQIQPDLSPAYKDEEGDYKSKMKTHYNMISVGFEF